MPLQLAFSHWFLAVYKPLESVPRSAAEGATTGAVIGAVTNGGKGAGIGAGIGGVAGLAVGMLSRGADVRLEPGTSIEMEIQREVTVDATRITSRREVVVRN
jgi:hypothetical protein